MASKLSFALLALLAALLVADATIVRTTVTTTEIDEEENPFHGGGTSTQRQCSAQQLRGRQLNKCKSYITQSSTSPYDILRVNPSTQEKRMLQGCCDELKNIERDLQNPQCACEALKKIIREETEEGSMGYQGQQEEIRPMLQKAKNIPQECNLQIRSCRIQEY